MTTMGIITLAELLNGFDDTDAKKAWAFRDINLTRPTLTILRWLARDLVIEDANGTENMWRGYMGIFDVRIAAELGITSSRAYSMTCTAVCELSKMLVAKDTLEVKDRLGRFGYGLGACRARRPEETYRIIEDYFLDNKAHVKNAPHRCVWVRPSDLFAELCTSMYRNTKEIYVISNNVNEMRYVGQAVNSRLRFKEHIKGARKGMGKQGSLESAIRSIGEQHFRYQRLELWATDANARERYWINKLNTLAPHGYNITPGGGNNWQAQKAFGINGN